MKWVIYAAFLILSSNLCFAQSQVVITEAKPVKRGQSYNIVWPAQLTSNSTARFELNKAGEKVWEESNIENSGLRVVQFPSYLKPGNDYAFNVFDDTALLSKSDQFSVKRKIPLGVWFTPVVVTGIILLVLPKENHLPSPPDPITPN